MAVFHIAIDRGAAAVAAVQKWIDLDELIPTVQSVLKVLISFDFSLAIFELGAPRAVASAPILAFLDDDAVQPLTVVAAKQPHSGTASRDT